MSMLLWFLLCVFMLYNFVSLLLMWRWYLSIRLIFSKSALTAFFLVLTFPSRHFLYESFCHTSFIISCCRIYFVKWWVKLWDLLLRLWIHFLWLEEVNCSFICWTARRFPLRAVRKRGWLLFWHELTCCDTWKKSFLLSWLTAKSRCCFFQYFRWVSTLLFTVS